MTQATMTLAQARAMAAAAKETAVDMTEQQASGGGGQRVLPDGYTMGRLVEVVEYGMQPQEFEGKAVKDAEDIQLGFALYDEGFCNDDGTPYVVRSFPFKVTRTAKSNAFKVFKVLNWQKLHTNWVDMLGEPFLIKIDQYEGNGQDGKKVTKSKLNLQGTLPPLNQRTKKPEDCPDLDESLIRLFLWEHPTMQCWDAFAATSKDDAGNARVSRVHEKLLSATNFAGSALESMLLEGGVKFSIPVKKEKAPAASAPAAAKAASTGAALPEPEPEGEDVPDMDLPFDMPAMP